ncbi:MAG: LacI family DNA-binding transcriptional regulator [Paracoccaceae bacterium]|nr:LacI family DNA-binding transcriptional regulator [Paracoccaceae bacterium]
MTGKSQSRVTIRDVAARAGVSSSLVSRALNNHPKSTASAGTRERILAAARQLDYQPNLIARGLRTARTHTIALLLPNLNNPALVRVANGASRRAKEKGYDIIFGTPPEGDVEDALSILLRQGRVDGLLVASARSKDSRLRRLADISTRPVVLINRRIEGALASVTVEDEAGAALAAQYLLDLGHQKFGAIQGPEDVDTARRRRSGFEQQLAKAGLVPVTAVCESWEGVEAITLTRNMFRQHPEITAVFASTFHMAVGALRGMREATIRVPEDVSVIAMHDNPSTSLLTPSLTAVEFAVEKMGEEAVNLLLQMIDGAPPRTVIVNDSPVIVPRESTSQPFHLFSG